MKIYKTWNSVIANYLPLFKNQSFIVFVPNTEEEKDFLYHFFCFFLTNFIKDLERIKKELEQISQEKVLNDKILLLLQTKTFYLVTALEEYIVPRDTFIELIKLVKEVLVYSIEKKHKEKLKKQGCLSSNLKPLIFKNGNIQINYQEKEKFEEYSKLKEDFFEEKMIKFINDEILLKFDKKKKTSN